MPHRAAQQAAVDRKPHPQRFGAQNLGRVLGHRIGAAAGFGGQQLAGIGMLRALENLGGGALLDNLARLHHADPVGDPPHHPQIMGDEQQAQPLARLEVSQQIKDLGLDGDIQRGGGLVGDQQFRPVGQRHRDHHPLALPTR